MKNWLLLACLSLVAVGNLAAQNYTPIAVTGYTHDAIAETYPNSLATTDTVMDASNYVMYSAAFASGGSFGGGLPNSGTIVDPSGTRTFQLAPYNDSNVLNVMRNASAAFTLVTPASYSKLSILAFSTEGASQINIDLEFTDGTSTSFTHNLPDWFHNTTNVVISGFGRVGRLASAFSVDGLTTNPRFYYIDLNLSCTDRKKDIQSIRFTNNTTTGGNAPWPNAVFLAVSGYEDTQDVTSSGTPASCGANNGTATVSVTGNSGPYTISWNTNPVQTTPGIVNLAAGTYVATITDAEGCVTTETVIVDQLISPTSITATASPSSVCAGGATQISVVATGGNLATHTWTPGDITTATFTANPTITTTYTVLGLDEAGCPYSRQVTVTVGQPPEAPVVPDVQVCGDDDAVLRVLNPQAAYVYNWYDAPAGGSLVATGPIYTISNPAAVMNYYVESVNGICNSASRTKVTASVLPKPTVNAGPDRTIVAGSSVQISGTASAGTYSWSPAAGLSSSTILNPVANPATSTTYILTVTHPLGCTASDTMELIVLPYCVKVMEAFTPNGDGMNDVWKVYDGSCVTSAKVGVFNRYGQEVYQSNDYKNDWDGTYKGKPLPDGTYYFIVTYKLVNSQSVYLKGNVTILR